MFFIDLFIVFELCVYNYGVVFVGMFRCLDWNYVKDVYIQFVLGKDKVFYKWVDVCGDEVWFFDGWVEDVMF